jgi:hypothetical protein
METSLREFQNRGMDWIAPVLFLLFLAGYIVAASTGATNKSFDEAAEGCFMLNLGALVIFAIIYGVFNAILSLF